MIKKVRFPKDIKPYKYYNTHGMYLRKIFEALGVQLEFVEDTTVSNGFTIDIDGTVIFIDYSDHLKIFKDHKQYKVYFKYHYTEKHRKLKNVYPFAPISFYDWKGFYQLRKEIKYTACTNLVLNMQATSSPGKASKCYERRTKVQNLLREHYNNDVVIKCVSPQTTYWKKINDCLVHVFVPGARPDVIDRGHLQYMGFGCCTIAPPISDILPYYRKFEPGIHYVQVEPDYSNLIEKIEWVKSNRKRAVEIGNNAQKLFDETCTPASLRMWITECLKKKKKEKGGKLNLYENSSTLPLSRDVY